LSKLVSPYLQWLTLPGASHSYMNRTMAHSIVHNRLVMDGVLVVALVHLGVS
jgi:hypothetical protein